MNHLDVSFTDETIRIPFNNTTKVDDLIRAAILRYKQIVTHILIFYRNLKKKCF